MSESGRYFNPLRASRREVVLALEFINPTNCSLSPVRSLERDLTVAAECVLCLYTATLEIVCVEEQLAPYESEAGS